MDPTHSRSDAEPVDESTLPRVPIWPVCTAAILALLGAILYVISPTASVFWIAVVIGGTSIGVSAGWHSRAARQAGYREPEYSSIPDGDGGGLWGPA